MQINLLKTPQSANLLRAIVSFLFRRTPTWASRFQILFLLRLSWLALSWASSAALRAEGELSVNPTQQGRLPDGRVSSRFVEKEFLYTGGKYYDDAVHYLLMSPASVNPNAKYPLIVWIHGHGVIEFQHETGILNWVDELVEAERGSFGEDYYILVPRCPKNEEWYSDFGDPAARFPDQKGGERLTIARAAIDHALAENAAIDRDRITATGVSSGGAACWELAMRNPGLFAAVAPIASAGGDLRRVGNLNGTAVWAFHNVGDEGTPIAGDRNTIAACHNSGVVATLTAFNDSGHNAWSRAFEKEHLRQWLLTQRRGANSTVSEVRFCLATGRNVKEVTAVGMFVLAGVAVRKEIKRRKSVRSSQKSTNLGLRS